MRDIFNTGRVLSELKRQEFRKTFIGKRPPFNIKKFGLFFLSCFISAIIMWLASTYLDINREADYMLGIFVLATILWTTETLPLYATALLIIALEIILLANPGHWDGFGFEVAADTPSYKEYLKPLSNPVIVLFFGGFLLARAVLKVGVDKALASSILSVFGGNPKMVLIGMMGITAGFSMWMSNTATTAMMITLVVPMLAQIPKGDPIRKGFLLAIPFAANIGGMGTPIASPPNAVALSFLTDAGYEISFLEWMLIAVPLMFGVLIFAWFLIIFLFKQKTPNLHLEPKPVSISSKGYFVMAVGIITIILWLTGNVHGLSTSVVALFPAIVFTASGTLNRFDVNSLEWHILILIMGGIALGGGMQSTGLDKILIESVPIDQSVMFISLVVTTIIFSTFLSNTAAANLVLPIGIAFAMNFNQNPIAVAIGISLAASLAMSLPISTPPNTIAYSNGELDTKDFVSAGAIIGVVAILLILLFGQPIINYWIN